MEEDNYIIMENGNRRRLYNKYLNPTYSQYREMNFPVFVGKTWSNETIGKKVGVRLINKYSAVSFEAVETPAGKFMAFRIHRETVLKENEKPIDDVSDFWYAPEVGRIVKSRLMILTEYKRSNK